MGKFIDFIHYIYFRLLPKRYKLKKYLCKDGTKHPVAVICPGGSYEMICSYVEGFPYAKALKKRGYNAFVVHYRTGKKAKYPNPQEDLNRAINEIFKHEKEWNLDCSNWSLWGSSAGGHLAASYCCEDWKTPKPAALILCYPVITMGEHTHKESKDNLIGSNADKEMLEKLSVECHISEDYPPTYICYGTGDTCVEPINSKMMEEALIKANVRHRIDSFEGLEHGFGPGKGTIAESWLDNAIRFWQS